MSAIQATWSEHTFEACSCFSNQLLLSQRSHFIVPALANARSLSMPPVIAALGMLLLAVPMGTLASPLSLDSITTTTKQRVELTLGVMSRCPDAVFAEAAFDRVIPRVLDEIALRFTYIGDEDEEEETGVRCKHGPQECECHPEAFL